MTPLPRAAYRTHSGRMLDLSCPDPDLIDLEDIAHHLARVCRFGGAVDGFYSVASHSVYVARELGREWQGRGSRTRVMAAGLMHDATEAYLGDMTSGLKRLFPEYRTLERQWEYAVERRFPQIGGVAAGIIKTADLKARLAEARDLWADGYPRDLLIGGEDGLEPFATPVVEQGPDAAEWEFLGLARELGLL